MSVPDLRASDADREATAGRLRAAAVEGRLTSDELEQRLEAALAAGTYGELEALVADLPASPPARPPRTKTRLRPELTTYLATAVLLVTIWALTGAGYFWPIWPILGWGVFVLGPARGACSVRASRGRPG
ncbi:MAG TPA: DUF1707 domain-containing protein [Thermoleophilaceae bacterium]|nr:DUF1707 domain-containing protein [Thermoleophilaceae bacterium]